MLSPPPVMTQCHLSTLLLSLYRCILVFSCFMLFHVFNALLCLPLCIKRCPVFVNTFNQAHEFLQLSLASNPATFTNKKLIQQCCPSETMFWKIFLLFQVLKFLWKQTAAFFLGTEWPDEFAEKIAQNVAQNILGVKISLK
jgi:hypothetical protein